jgi:hypothetical protein
LHGDVPGGAGRDADRGGVLTWTSIGCVMGAASRRKGLGGEREVAEGFRAAGHQVRGLEGEGDWLCVNPRVPGQPLLHLECKRAERLKLPEWTRQAESEAPVGAVAIVAYRQNREPWRVSLRLDELLRLLG